MSAPNKTNAKSLRNSPTKGNHVTSKPLTSRPEQNSAINSAPMSGNKKKKRKMKVKLRPTGNLGQQMTKAYIQTLADPFNYPGIHLGFGSLYNGQLAAAYYRYAYTTTANDNSAIFCLNSDAALHSLGGNNTFDSAVSRSNSLDAYISGFKYLNNVYLTTNGYLKSTANNYASLSGQFRSYKIISSGIRVTVSSPLTGAGGTFMMARFPGMARTSFDSVTPASLLGYSGINIHSVTGGSSTAQLNWLPGDPSDFAYGLGSNSSNGDLIYNPTVVCVDNLPVGSRVFLECITHIECEGAFNSGISDPEVTDGTLADEWPSIESMWNVVKSTVQGISKACEIFEGTPFYSNNLENFTPYKGKAFTLNDKRTDTEFKKGDPAPVDPSNPLIPDPYWPDPPEEKGPRQRSNSLVSEAEAISDELASIEAKDPESRNALRVLKQKLDAILDEISINMKN